MRLAGMTMAAERIAIDGAFAVPPPPDWDDWLNRCGGNAGFCQSTERAQIVHARRNAVSYVLTVEDNGNRLAGVLLTLIPAETPQRNWLRGARSWLSGLASGELVGLEGPVLAAGDKPAALAKLLAKVDSVAAQTGVTRIRFSGGPVMADWGGDADIAAVFRRFGYREVPWFTALVDLAPPEDRLFSGLKHAARKGVRKCRGAGLKVSQVGTYDEFQRDFLVPYFESLSDGNVFHTPPDDRAWWMIDRGRHYRFFVAKDSAGAVHATLGSYAFNGVATEIMSCRTSVGQSVNLPAQDLLHWEAFRIHKSAGDQWFNLAGFNPSPRDAKEAGIRRFKLKWGGREVSVPQFQRGKPPALARVANALFGRTAQ